MAEEPEKKKMTPEERLFKAVVNDKREFDLDDEEDFFEEPGGGFLGRLGDALAKADRTARRWLKKGFGGMTERLAVKHKGASAAFDAAWKGQLAQVAQLQTANRVLVVFMVLLGLYLTYDLVFGRLAFDRVRAQTDPPVAIETYALVPAYPAQGEKPLSYYLASADSRNVFLPPHAAGPAGSAGIPGLEPPPVQYKLVGISWDLEGFVAMVESPKENRARFVREGETLPDGTEVKKITEKAVSLARGDGKWELT